MKVTPNSIFQSSWRAWIVALVCIVCVPVHAATIAFDPDGTAVANSAVNAATFDFSVGNSIFQNIGNITTSQSAHTVTQYTQTRLGNLLSSGGSVIPIAGLNSLSGFEITIAI